MIKTNDLRFTNWVIFNGEYRQAKYVFFSDGNPFKNDELKVEPIPLTPEILEKCGFIQWSEGYWSHKNIAFMGYYYLPYNIFRDAICYSINENTSHYTKIENLNQLQNLYHALTGEELIINL